MRNENSILIIDDDIVDAMTIKRAFKDMEVNNRIDLVGNGEEAIRFLNDENNPRPCLIILDLNMPKMSGIEFLKIIKRDDVLKMIPVIVLTTSRDKHDKMDSFKLSVAGYMVKPVDYSQFLEVMKTINMYWTVSELPN